MYRPAHLIIAGALMDLALTISIAAGDLGNLQQLSDATWFLLDAVALALIGFGLLQSGRACLPFAAGWLCFSVAHVIISFDPGLAGPLLAGGDILIAITGTVSAILSARTNGWNGKSTLLLLAALSVLAIPLAVGIGGDAGLDVALPFYSLVSVALGLGLTRDQSQRLPTSVAA
jgi:hypothetical protein